MSRRELWCVPGPGDHPYFQRIYSASDRHGLAMRYARVVADIPETTTDAIINVNWVWLRMFPSVAEARAFVAETIDHLDRLIANGCQLVWSIHEPAHHDLVHPAEEAQLYRQLVQRASLVHVLSEATAGRCAHLFDLADHPVAYHPIPAPDLVRAAVDRVQLFGPTGDVDIVAALGYRRAYKEFEVIARAVNRRNGRGDHRPSIVLNVGPSLVFPMDRISARLERLGAAVIEARVPDDIYWQLLLGGDAIALPYSRGMNSGVLAESIAAGAPTVLSQHMRLPEFDFIPEPACFDFDAGHRAVDGALGYVLDADRSVWHGLADRFRQAAAPLEVSDRFLAEIVRRLDAPTSIDPTSIEPPTYDESADDVTDRLLKARLVRNERAHLAAMRAVADLAASADAVDAEFEALVGIVENHLFEPRGSELARMFALAGRLGRQRIAVSAAHRAIDMRPEIAQRVLDDIEPAGDPLIEVALTDIESRIGEHRERPPAAAAVAGHVAAIVQGSGADG